MPSASPSAHVQARKGSMCASDPWGLHTELNMNPSRTTSCTLTIVRVNPPPIQLDDAPPSPQHRRHFGFGHHRRHASNSSVASNSSIGGPAAKPDVPRLSFASATFAAPGSPTATASSSPSSRPTSPTLARPRSPTGSGTHRHAAASVSKPRLSPDQLVHLAHQSCNPRSAAPSPAHSPHSPGHLPAAPPYTTTPASFTALADDVYLPFIDRAPEVAALFAGPPSAKLLTLLAQIFPTPQSDDPPPAALFRRDPREWTFAQLEHWLKRVDRDLVPDPAWILCARRCVLAHSELVWERLKGALGSPPELDPDDFEEYDPALLPYMLASAVQPFPARDDDDDGDATPAGLLSEGLVGSLSPEQDSVARAVAAHRAACAADDPPPSPGVLRSPYREPGALSIEPVFAPSSPPAEHEHEHPPTRAGAHRMQDISEEVRESEEDAAEDAAALAAAAAAAAGGAAGGGAGAPARPAAPREVMQGIRISTAPASPGLFAAGSSPETRPRSFSPLPPAACASPSASPSASASAYASAHQAAAGAVSDPVSVRAMAEHNAYAPAADSRERDRERDRDSNRDRDSVHEGSVGRHHHYYASSTASSDIPYDVVGERGPGNPLFPQSFARLALGPTLSANNPQLRSPSAPPPPAFANPHAIRMGVRGRRAVPSWAESWDPLKHEYAVTLASGSSVGGP